MKNRMKEIEERRRAECLQEKKKEKVLQAL